ncbi:MAG TPA: isocitrate lyase/phosphoenolpyruvate mutase family protein [Pyrinomonadaceae bacterium]|jgi:2-methylisocitrate lyase-like PEP mutase family enzyme
MTATNSRQSSVVEKFHALHASGCFVLPNPWDAGSAIYLEQLGFKALASTSAGFAFSRGLPDSPSGVSRELVLTHLRELVEATSLPVNADFQNGYANSAEDLAESVKLCVATGVAGLSIEDNSENPGAPLYDFQTAVDRVKAARAAIDATGTSVVLTARCEAWLVGQANPLQVAIERLAAFAEAGADCLYAPGVRQPDEIAAIVKAVVPKPVNVLVSTGNRELTFSQLADLGVRRISVGSALANVAWGAFIRAAREIAETGKFDAFANAASFAELNKLFASRMQPV